MISLSKPYRRILFFLCFLLLALYGFAVLKLALADYCGRIVQPESLLRAIRLQPTNADYENRLGRLFLFDMSRANPGAAIAHLERAVALNPHSADFWVDLAFAYEHNGQLEVAEQAYRHAQESYPRSADMAWAKANFYLRQGRLAESYAEFRRALEANPGLQRLAFQLLWRASDDTEAILAQAIPDEVSYQASALSYLVSLRWWEHAERVWRHLQASSGKLHRGEILSYVDSLIAAHRVESAAAVWKELLHRQNVEEPGLVTNGSFERPPWEGGFDWRWQAIPGGEFDQDAAVACQGRQSGRIIFDGSRDFDFHHLQQYVVVEPSTRYRFQAFLKTAALSPGVRFHITDPYTGAFDLQTEGLAGTRDWTGQQIEFRTTPKTKVILLTLRRLPSHEIETKLRGTVWVDAVSLTRAGGRYQP